MTPNYNVKDKLSIYDGLVFREEWLVVPQGLSRADEKRELHASHAGVYVDIRTSRVTAFNACKKAFTQRVFGLQIELQIVNPF